MNWCDSKQITGVPQDYNQYFTAHKAKNQQVPESIWEYFDYDLYLLDLWRSKKIHILYVDEEDGIVSLDNVGSVYPVWAGKVTEWFTNNPFKDQFYIIERQQYSYPIVNLTSEFQELRNDIRRLKRQHDFYKTELDRIYHAWDRDDLEEWAVEKGVEITDKMWRDWCNFWMDIYNLQYEQEAMKQAMDDWWNSREFE